MIDLRLLNEPNAANQRKAVKAALVDIIDKGEFTYTEILAVPEPLRTYALAALDGVVIEGTLPKYMQEPPLDGGGGPLLLVHVDPQGEIKHPVRREVKIPGTHNTRLEEMTKSFGNVALVPDVMPERHARQILYQQGWPIRQMQSAGSQVGAVVEWRWLEKEARSGTPTEGAMELYQEILQRPSFQALTGGVQGQAKTEIKNPKPPAREARAGV